MKHVLIFQEKEHCLDHYRKLSPDEDERGLIRKHLLHRKYPSWFEYPEFTEEENRELDAEIEKSEKRIKALKEQRLSQKQETFSS